MHKGFTLIELLVVTAIVVVLSMIVLFSVSLYVNSGKDASIQGNLAVLITAGETYYDINGTLGYNFFCGQDVVKNAFDQIPSLPSSNCFNDSNKGIPCCRDSQNQWVACSQEFSNKDRAFCVDSRGVKKEICNYSCNSIFLDDMECPNDNLPAACP